MSITPSRNELMRMHQEAEQRERIQTLEEALGEVLTWAEEHPDTEGLSDIRRKLRELLVSGRQAPTHYMLDVCPHCLNQVDVEKGGAYCNQCKVTVTAKQLRLVPGERTSCLSIR